MVGNTGWKKFAVISIFLLPNLAGFLFFIGIPIISSFVLSFTSWDLLSPPQFVGVDNYINLLRDPSFFNALTNTLLFIAGYLPTVMVLALIVALLLNRRLRFRVFFRAAYFVPVITSWVAVALIWKWMFNPSYGLVNYFLSLIGINGPAWLQDPSWAMPSIIITSVWKDIGFVMVIFLAGLQGIPENYYEAADIDGANGWQKFRYVTLPLLAPTTFFVLVISLINSFQVFDQVMIMTEGGPAGATTVMVQEIYNHAFRYFQMGYASALSWVLFALIFVVTFIQMRWQKRWVDYGK
ncbi:multiple sugar transport system permease protein [Caldalkalibacillus uzonensis]|uniref:Multiple sugar transport system permease protein n=1 Tax=Caldalkalibacillus uzonensis TaxID=353224 RepID=A0ABU0CPZ5_9BACI|nr:sugar ABC transporter permease [Caldalkalibacillus uzonensis]MDQ0338465.1 multiple sugar transport system permease protein [Caldalkalibacillus uzonensis]